MSVFIKKLVGFAGVIILILFTIILVYISSSHSTRCKIFGRVTVLDLSSGELFEESYLLGAKISISRIYEPIWVQKTPRPLLKIVGSRTRLHLESGNYNSAELIQLLKRYRSLVHENPQMITEGENSFQRAFLEQNLPEIERHLLKIENLKTRIK